MQKLNNFSTVGIRNKFRNVTILLYDIKYNFKIRSVQFQVRLNFGELFSDPYCNT